jgi:hypothetical protein
MAKKGAIKTVGVSHIFSDDRWTVNYGELVAVSGGEEERPPLFAAVGEKLPFEALAKVRNHIRKVSRLRAYTSHTTQ